MGLFGQLFGYGQDKAATDLLPAIERAVSLIDPLLKHKGGYPGNYRKPVATALEYAHSLAASVPGPVDISREAYALDPFVHALFPSAEQVEDAFNASMALQEYQCDFPSVGELYALMGMRRFEKKMVGMELSGDVIQRDVVQTVVYFTSHTIENPATSEEQARSQAALSFFDSLAGKVKKRMEARKQDMQALLQKKDLLMAHLRTADAQARPDLEKELSGVLATTQASAGLPNPRQYAEDFEAVFQNPEQHLRLDRIPITLDSMGIKRKAEDTHSGEEHIFNELIGFDKRNWTVTMVHCSNLQTESFATKLDKAYRKLAL